VPITVRALADEDHERSWGLVRLAFGGPATFDESWLARVRSAAGFLAEVDGRMAGVLRVRPYGQLFGGRSVPMGGVAGVAVDPWARGRGVAQGLLDAALPAMREAGQVVSALYPTAPPLYRSRGWEMAGVLEDLSVAPAALGAVARQGEVGLRPAGPDDLDDLHACYQAVAMAQDGMLDRDGPSFSLAAVLDLDVVTICPGRGYLTATRHADRLQVHDLVALDDEVGRALLHLLSSWGGYLKRIDIRPTDPQPLTTLAAAGLAGDVHVTPWMLRVVDLPAAVDARGWPAARALRNAAADLEVTDPWAPWNQGRWRLVVEDGAVRCEPGGDGSVQLTARALGPWFAGGTPTSALRRSGLLAGADADADLLDVLVAGRATPRMADYF
jgi:predicted acetyltransferase